MYKSRKKTNITNLFPLSLFLLLGMSFTQSCTPCAIQRGEKGNHVKYEIKKGACFGSCPVYKMYVFADGDAFLYAANNVEDEGMFYRPLTEEEYKMLCGHFKKAHWSKLRDSYGADVLDLPDIYLTLHDKKSSKTVLAKDGIPDALIAVSNAFEQLRNSGHWKKVFVDPVREHFDTRYLVINIDRDATLDLLEKKYAEFGLKRSDKIAPKLSYWEMQFDASKIDPELMFFILRKDPLVKEVSFIRTNVREPKARPKS